MVEALPVAPQNDVADVFEPSNEEPAQEESPARSRWRSLRPAG